MQTPTHGALSVPLDLLLARLALDSYKDLRNLLKANGLRIISRSKPISLSEANQIISRLRSPELKIHKRDLDRYTFDPISTSSITVDHLAASIPPDMMSFAKNIFTRTQAYSSNSAVYAVAIQGGFFTDLTREAFFLNSRLEFIS
jgi:hypothetical protein